MRLSTFKKRTLSVLLHPTVKTPRKKKNSHCNLFEPLIVYTGVLLNQWREKATAIVQENIPVFTLEEDSGRKIIIYNLLKVL